jgi:hypothetical protein
VVGAQRAQSSSRRGSAQGIYQPHIIQDVGSLPSGGPEPVYIVFVSLVLFPQ